jgi:hypothetical protein
MDKLDEALRGTIKKLWPIDGKKMHNMLIPPNEGNVLTDSLSPIVIVLFIYYATVQLKIDNILALPILL